MAKYKIIQLKNECIMCGACAAICPEFFEMDEEGLAHMKGSIQNGDNWELLIDTENDKAHIQEAVDACPVSIIKIEEEK